MNNSVESVHNSPEIVLETMDSRSNNPIPLGLRCGSKSESGMGYFEVIQTWTIAALRMKHDDGYRGFGEALLIIRFSPQVFPWFYRRRLYLMNTNTPLHLHLVSDATGDTVRSVARACLVQFEEIDTTEHFWVLVRSAAQMERVIEGIAKNPGIVLCTVVDEALRAALEQACRQLKVRYVPLLDPVISAIASHVGGRSRGLPGRQHSLDAAYFDRIEAMHYTMAHDDGQSLDTLHDADLILVGVSRTSKTPTSIYLANRGLKTANVPFVPEVPLPKQLGQLSGPLILGLTVHPARLIQIRRNRLLMLKEENETAYVDIERVEREVREARRFFLSKNWPIIDVTRRSIEETAAAIVQVYERHMGGEDAHNEI